MLRNPVHRWHLEKNRLSGEGSQGNHGDDSVLCAVEHRDSVAKVKRRVDPVGLQVDRQTVRITVDRDVRDCGVRAGVDNRDGVVDRARHVDAIGRRIERDCGRAMVEGNGLFVLMRMTLAIAALIT